MAYDLSFAGVSFRIPTDEVLERIRRFDWLADLRDVLPAPQVFPGPNLQRAGLPTPLRYPDVRIGDFFYPVGACRWSIFRGLMAADDLTAVTNTLKTQTATANTSRQMQGTFKIQSEGGDAAGSVTTKLFMLPPIPIMGGPTAPTLYLVNLVDERYFWQWWMSAGDCTGSVFDSWSAYLNQLATQLNITLTFTTPDSVYGMPEIDSPLCTGGFDNPAALLDLVAANVGCAVVRNLDGTYKLQRYADALAAAQANRPASRNNLLGGPSWSDPPSASSPGDYFTMIPATVRIVFPVWIDNDGAVNIAIGTSSDSLTIGLTAQDLVVGPDLSFVVGTRVRITDAANSANYMEGVVSSYDGGTGSLHVFVDLVGGAGTYTNWNVSYIGFRTGYDSVERSSYTDREYYRDNYPTTAYLDVATSSLGSPYTDYPTFTDPGVKIIRTTFKARYDQFADPPWTNLTASTNLATQLAKDYLDARLAWTDETYAGIYPWPPEGISDLLYGWRQGEAFTRALAPPLNAGPTDFQHGIPEGGLWIPDEHLVRVGDGVSSTVYQAIGTLIFSNLDVVCDPVHRFATMTTHGATGSFTTADGKTISVANGLIDAISGP